MTYNSDHFDLTKWKLTLPVDSTGSIVGNAFEVTNLKGYESAYFYDAADGAMVFAAQTDGATTSGSHYPRSELREMSGGKTYNWNLSEGGTMTATLKVDSVPTRTDGTPGREIIGQIHGQNKELIRLYWQNNTVYFMNEQSGTDNKEHQFNFLNAAGQAPNIALGEKFSYKIDAHGNTMKVDIYADGQVYSSTSTLNAIWQADTFYFKAGVYLGVDETQGSGTGQVSFYGLDYSHILGSGLGGLTQVASTPAPTPVPVVPVVPVLPVPAADTTGTSHAVSGTDASDRLIGTDSADSIIGMGGNDSLKGGMGADYMHGNQGDDTLEGAQGNDTLLGGEGNDKIVGGQGDDLIVGGLGNDYIQGDLGNDSIDGGAGNDSIYGGDGNDILLGGLGDDQVKGDNGNDVIYGGGGNDSLTGGSGNDRFVIENLTGAASIRDFHNGEDTIDLTAFHFTSFNQVKALVVGDFVLRLDADTSLQVMGLSSSTFDASDVFI